MPSDILKNIFQNTLTGLAALTAIVAFMFFKEYLGFKLKMQRIAKGISDSEESANDEQPKTPKMLPVPARNLDDPKNVVSSNFQLLERYYDQTLAEYRLNSRATVAIAMLGFLAILIGIGIAYAGTIAVGVVSSAAGVLAEAATVMFFRQNQEQIKQVQEYHKELVSTQYLLTAVSLADSLEGDMREAEVKRIILNLLYLSNELHGSKSPHLLLEGQAANDALAVPNKVVVANARSQVSAS
ncbi:MAG: hypothetical protein JWQ87_177 [Candidatus Sulfotelmatobacter sp.]|nr:hypothetical protein [Candidatus Sulfotelmatobacter sp.]